MSSSTQWNWSWVASTDNTLKASESIDQSGGTLYTYRAPNRGQLSAEDISTSIDSISTNINQQWRLWRSYIRPIIDSLPAGEKDQRWRPGIGLPPKINALANGIQGTTIFVFNDATSAKADGRYWHTDDERPKTIAEVVEDIRYDLSALEATFSVPDTTYDDTDLWYAIGNRYEDPLLTSASGSLDKRCDTLESNDSQIEEDVYGGVFGTYGWGYPLTYTVAKNIHELLKIHDVATGWQQNPTGVGHVGIDRNTLDEAYDEGGAGLGRTIYATNGSVVIDVANSSNNTALELIQRDTTNNPNTLKITNYSTTGYSLEFAQYAKIASFNDLSITLTAAGKNMSITTQDKELQLFNTDAVVDSDKAFYFGASTVDGSWRIVRSGNNLLMERRESSSWVTKHTVTP